MPDTATVNRWILGFTPPPIPDFARAYAQARRIQHEVWADEIVTIADDAQGQDMPNVAAAKLRTDNRKWLLARLRPEVYGDRLQMDGVNSKAEINIFLPAKSTAGDGARIINGTGHEATSPALDLAGHPVTRRHGDSSEPDPDSDSEPDRDE